MGSSLCTGEARRLLAPDYKLSCWPAFLPELSDRQPMKVDEPWISFIIWPIASMIDEPRLQPMRATIQAGHQLGRFSREKMKGSRHKWDLATPFDKKPALVIFWNPSLIFLIDSAWVHLQA